MGRMFKACLATLAISAVAIPANASAAEPLTGAQIEQLLTGKTVSGRRMAMTFSMTFNADGSMDASMGPMSQQGRWSIEGDMLCTDMPRRPQNADRCQALEQTAPNRLQNAAGMVLTIE